jgi:hypothetical protein
VTLKVFDVAGREVSTLISGRLFAGSYKTVWIPGSIASGVYLYRLQAGSYVVSRSMVLLK